jgi:ribA/ribD-fused uncharacterized protein
MREKNNYIYFWTNWLSNWHYCNIKYHDIIFNTSEQLFMYLKAYYFGDDKSVGKIINSKIPKEAKDFGRLVKNFDLKEWEYERENAMFIACYEKFNQNEYLKEKLLKTNDKILVEGNIYDNIWAVGIDYRDEAIEDKKNWTGLNLLGKCLMEVREKLKEEQNV